MDALGALKDLIVKDGVIHIPMAPSMVEQAPLRLRPKHRHCIMLHELGYKGSEIARMVGYSEPRVSVILNWQGPEVDKYRQEARDQVQARTLEVGDRINVSAHEMLDVMMHHARNLKDASNSRLAARDILHMAGFSPVKKTASINANVNVPPELQDAVKQMDKFHEIQMKQDQWRIVEPMKKDGTNG